MTPLEASKRTRDICGLAPIVPVLVVNDVAHARPLGEALVAGGLPALEVTLRTPAAVEAIGRIAREVPEAVVGAGTVLTAADLEAVEAAGGLFAISPGLTPGLLEAADSGGIALIPGVATASELMTGLERGYDHLKFFPAEAAGGVRALKAISGPFPQVTFCPTGGITPGNYHDYLALDNVVCVGGSWLVPAEAMAKKDWPRITELAAAAVAGAKGSR